MKAKSFLSFITGVAIGSVATILLTPQRNRKSRKELAKKSKKFKKAFRESAAKYKEKLRDLKHDADDKAKDLKGKFD